MDFGLEKCATTDFVSGKPMQIAPIILDTNIITREIDP